MVVVNDPAAADDGNVYSSGFVMAITEFRISGVSGVAPVVVIVPTLKFDVLVTVAAEEAAAAAAADDDGGTTATWTGETISTFTIGIPFILSLKL